MNNQDNKLELIMKKAGEEDEKFGNTIIKNMGINGTCIIFRRLTSNVQMVMLCWMTHDKTTVMEGFSAEELIPYI